MLSMHYSGRPRSGWSCIYEPDMSHSCIMQYVSLDRARRAPCMRACMLCFAACTRFVYVTGPGTVGRRAPARTCRRHMLTCMTPDPPACTPIRVVCTSVVEWRVGPLFLLSSPSLCMRDLQTVFLPADREKDYSWLELIDDDSIFRSAGTPSHMHDDMNYSQCIILVRAKVKV